MYLMGLNAICMIYEEKKSFCVGARMELEEYRFVENLFYVGHRVWLFYTASRTKMPLKCHGRPLLQNNDDKMSIKWIVKQVNAPIKVGIADWIWCSEHGLRLMQWQSRLPDLNPIENVRSWFSRAVYAKKTFLQRSWVKMPCAKLVG